MGPSPVYVSNPTPFRPKAGGISTGPLILSTLNRGSNLPGPHELYTAFCASVSAGERAIIAPGFKSLFGQPSSRLPTPAATESSTVEWQRAHVIPTDLSWGPETLPTKPTTALSLISSTVVAGLFKSRVTRKSGGSAAASTLRPTASAVAGLTDDWMTSCRRRVSVQNCSSPKVSNRKIC